MGLINKTSVFTCRFLNEDYFSVLHKSFMEAFSDYLVPFNISVEQFERHIQLTAVDLNRSVGCFVDEKMVGFTLNGFGMWNGRSTVYDAGTGVLPAFRRQGMSRAMFDFMFPVFKARGVEQCLLEVISTNEKALNLYRGLGFEKTRKLSVLKAEPALKFARPLPEDIKVRKIREPDWELFETFWDGQPSWQNSTDAVRRSAADRNILGAFLDDTLIGYIIFSVYSGKLAQMAVDKDKRNRGAGSLLLMSMQTEAKDGKSLQVINIDESLTGAYRFFQNRGFAESFNQGEMIKAL